MARPKLPSCDGVRPQTSHEGASICTHLSLGVLASPLVLAVAEEFDDAALVRREAVGVRRALASVGVVVFPPAVSSKLCHAREVCAVEPSHHDTWATPACAVHGRHDAEYGRLSFQPLLRCRLFCSSTNAIVIGYNYSQTERHNSPRHLLDNGPHKLGPLARLALSGRRARLGDTSRSFLLPCQHSGVSRRVVITGFFGERKTA